MSALFVDTSALVHRFIAGRHRELVTSEMSSAAEIVSSALTRSELPLVFARTVTSRRQLDRLLAEFDRDWSTFWEVPIDRTCLEAAERIGVTFGLPILDSIQLASADRLPRPVRYCTLEGRQIAAAVELGFDVVAPVSERE